VRVLKKEIWPYQCLAASNDCSQIDDWCVQVVGRRCDTWFSYYTGEAKRIYAFKDEEALFIFKLTWSKECHLLEEQ
jgi:hypothetical protein